MTAKPMTKETTAKAFRKGRVLGPLLAALLLGACAGASPEAESGAGESAATPAVSSDEAVSFEEANTLESKDGTIAYPEWETTAPGEYLEYNQRANLLQRGHLVYQKYCIGCHGEHGDGYGPAAARLQTRPRDFTRGIYKFRSTDSGSLPLESDLYRTITRGLARVSMPAFRLMPENERIAVIEYIKTFYPQWETKKADRRIVPIPLPPEDLLAEDRLLRGRAVYLQMQCWKCHGVDGRGTGATQTEYVDAWGDTQKPFDFTRGSLKGGSAPEDIYRTFHTGLRSIMPSYDGETLAAVTGEAFGDMGTFLEADEKAAVESIQNQFPADGAALYGQEPEERQELAVRNSWDLVAYILSLRSETTTAPAVLGAP